MRVFVKSNELAYVYYEEVQNECRTPECPPWDTAFSRLARILGGDKIWPPANLKGLSHA